MERNATERLPENELAFERERLLNLIDSKIKRKEMETARGLAEELFKAEIGFALLKKTRVLRRYTDLLLRIIFALVGVLLACTVAMVLNMRPSLGLLGQVLAVLGIILAVLVEGLILKRYEKVLKTIIDKYETQKQIFIDRVLAGGIPCRLEEWWRGCGLR